MSWTEEPEWGQRHGLPELIAFTPDQYMQIAIDLAQNEDRLDWLRRGMRARNSTDAVIPSRAGYPTATLASMNRYKALSNYHLMSDTPENVDYRTVRQALVLTEAVARELASNPWV